MADRPIKDALVRSHVVSAKSICDFATKNALHILWIRAMPETEIPPAMRVDYYLTTQLQVAYCSKNKLLYYAFLNAIINAESGFNKYCEVIL